MYVYVLANIFSDADPNSYLGMCAVAESVDDALRMDPYRNPVFSKVWGLVDGRTWTPPDRDDVFTIGKARTDLPAGVLCVTDSDLYYIRDMKGYRDKLYLVCRTDRPAADSICAFITVAKDAREARRIHPLNLRKGEEYSYDEIYGWGQGDADWVPLDSVSTHYLGPASRSLEGDRVVFISWPLHNKLG